MPRLPLSFVRCVDCGHVYNCEFDIPAVPYTKKPNPMINLGGFGVKVLSDGWTAVTRDKQLSAQFEHSVGITETGVEFFTLSPKGLAKPPYDLEAVHPADKQAASA